MGGALHFAADFEDQWILQDGTRAVVRGVRPDDKSLLLKGMAQLSAESIYLRFFTAKTHLTPKELSYLTEVDGQNHFAVGALDEKSGEGMGIARFIRDAKQPETAEPAIVVLDQHQGKGLGRLLFDCLIEAARERGIRFFRCEVMARNEAMQSLIRSFSDETVLEHQGSVVIMSFQLPGCEAQEVLQKEERPFPLHRLLSLVASGELLIRTLATIGLLPSRSEPAGKTKPKKKPESEPEPPVVGEAQE